MSRSRQEIIKMLQDEYQGQNVTPERADNLLRLTAHVPVNDLEAATLEHIKTQDFFPRVAQLLRTVKHVQEASAVLSRVERESHHMTDDVRFAAEVELGLMRPLPEIEMEIAECKRGLGKIDVNSIIKR